MLDLNEMNTVPLRSQSLSASSSRNGYAQPWKRERHGDSMARFVGRYTLLVLTAILSGTVCYTATSARGSPSTTFGHREVWPTPPREAAAAAAWVPGAREAAGGPGKQSYFGRPSERGNLPYAFLRATHIQAAESRAPQERRPVEAGPRYASMSEAEAAGMEEEDHKAKGLLGALPSESEQLKRLRSRDPSLSNSGGEKHSLVWPGPSPYTSEGANGEEEELKQGEEGGRTRQEREEEEEEKKREPKDKKLYMEGGEGDVKEKKDKEGEGEKKEEEARAEGTEKGEQEGKHEEEGEGSEKKEEEKLKADKTENAEHDTKQEGSGVGSEKNKVEEGATVGGKVKSEHEGEQGEAVEGSEGRKEGEDVTEGKTGVDIQGGKKDGEKGEGANQDLVRAHLFLEKEHQILERPLLSELVRPFYFEHPLCIMGSSRWCGGESKANEGMPPYSFREMIRPLDSLVWSIFKLPRFDISFPFSPFQSAERAGSVRTGGA